MAIFTRETLLKRIKNRDDQSSWEDFFNTYSLYLGAVLKNMGVPKSDIDDLIQSVMLVSWEKLPEFQYNSERGKFRYWLCQTASFKAKNHLRKNARRAMINENEIDVQSSKKADIEKIAEDEWQVFISRKAWDIVRENLSGKMKQVYEMVLQGKSTDEIAAETEMETGSVLVYRRRVEKKIIEEVKRLQVIMD